MLKVQLQWLPGWKFPEFIDAALQRTNSFLEELLNETPYVIASPCLNPYPPNVTFLYPLKTSENLRFSDVFRGYRNVTLGEHGLICIFKILKILILSQLN